jgi:hypothetical protein
MLLRRFSFWFAMDCHNMNFSNTQRCSCDHETLTFYQNDLAIRNTADVTGGKPIAVCSQSISGVSAVNLLVAFPDIHVRKVEVILFWYFPDTTHGTYILNMFLYVQRM